MNDYIPSMSDRLKVEIDTFEAMRPDLERHHKGKHVLIKGTLLVGTFDHFNAAAAEGLRLYPTEDFLIRQVGSHSPKLSPAILYGLLNADTQGGIRIAESGTGLSSEESDTALEDVEA